MAPLYPESWSPGGKKMETVLWIRFLSLKNKESPHPRKCETVASMAFDFQNEKWNLPDPKPKLINPMTKQLCCLQS